MAPQDNGQTLPPPKVAEPKPTELERLCKSCGKIREIDRFPYTSPPGSVKRYRSRTCKYCNKYGKVKRDRLKLQMNKDKIMQAMLGKINHAKWQDLPSIQQMVATSFSVFGGLHQWCTRVKAIADKAEEKGQFKVALDCMMSIPKLVAMIPEEKDVDLSQANEEDIRAALKELMHEYSLEAASDGEVQLLKDDDSNVEIAANEEDEQLDEVPEDYDPALVEDEE